MVLLWDEKCLKLTQLHTHLYIPLWFYYGDESYLQHKIDQIFTFHCGSIMGSPACFKTAFYNLLYIPLWFYYGPIWLLALRRFWLPLHSTVVLLWAEVFQIQQTKLKKLYIPLWFYYGENEAKKNAPWVDLYIPLWFYYG